MYKNNILYRIRFKKNLNSVFLLLVFALTGQPSLHAQNAPQPAPTQAPVAGTTSTIIRDLPGFADTEWKSTYSDVKRRFSSLATSDTSVERVELINAVRNKEMLVKRNEILYLYTFYKTPYQVKRINNHTLSFEEWDQEEAVLFHVKVLMPFIETKLIKLKLEDNFGQITRSTVKDDLRGVDVWELNGGTIFLWYEPLHKKAYTRIIDYVSQEMFVAIEKEFADYFDAHEKRLARLLITR